MLTRTGISETHSTLVPALKRFATHSAYTLSRALRDRELLLK